MIYWLPSLAWMGVIFYLSGRTGGELHSLFPFINNFNPGHIAAYFILALLYYAALRKNKHRRPFMKAFFLCLFYGITDEVHQQFVPTRYPDIYDLIRDLLGAALALAAVFLVEKHYHKRRLNTET